MSRDDVGRAFVVGCPRSGTTLLQTMLAAHPDVVSFPETHYFRSVWGRSFPWRRSRVVSPRAAALTLDKLMDWTGSTRPRPRVPRHWPFFGAYARAFVRVVDGACVDQGGAMWVEKSPVHLRVRAEIVRSVPRARFVHIVRDGRDVVASIHERCHEDPTRWLPQVLPRDRRGAPTPNELLDAIVDRWNADVAVTVAARAHGDCVVSFERLQREPQATLKRVCEHLGLTFDPAMLRFWEVADAVVGTRARFSHMQGVFDPLRVEEPGARFERVFDESQRRRVRARLRAAGDVDLALDA
jgi:hypothetical protein